MGGLFLMKKLLLTSILTIALVTPVFANSAGPITEAKSAILIETSTGRVLHEQDPHEKLPPASVTKVMTMLLVYEALEQGKIAWEDQVTISDTPLIWAVPRSF